MNFKMKGMPVLAVSMVIILISSLLAVQVIGAQDSVGDAAIKVTIDGVLQQYDQPPVIINNRTMVPLRAIFEALDAKIDWEDATRTVTAIKADKVIKLTIESKIAYVDNKEVMLDQPAALINGRTLVPVRFIGEALGTKVDWDEANSTVIITKPDASPVSNPTPTPTPTAPADDIVPPAPPVSKDNLIADPTMEGARFTGANYEATPTYVKTTAHTGKQSLQVVAKKEYGCVKFPPSKIEQGKDYSYSAWVKLGADSQSTAVNIIICYTVGDELIQKKVATSPPLNTTEWKQVSGFYTIDSDEKIVDPYVSMYADKPIGPGTFYVDDVEVKLADFDSYNNDASADKDAPAVSAPPAPPVSKENLIKDPTMEGARFTGSNYRAKPTYVKTQAHTGKQALQVVAEEGFGCVKFPPCKILPGKEYSYSAWVKLGPDSPSTVINMIINYMEGDDLIQKIAATSSPVNTTEWTQITGSYTIDENANPSETFVSMFADKPIGPGTFFVDDVEVKLVK